MWNKLMKLVDLGEPTSFLDHVFSEFTERERKPNEIVIESEKCSNHELLPEQLKNYLGEISRKNCRLVL